MRGRKSTPASQQPVSDRWLYILARGASILIVLSVVTILGFLLHQSFPLFQGPQLGDWIKAEGLAPLVKSFPGASGRDNWKKRISEEGSVWQVTPEKTVRKEEYRFQPQEKSEGGKWTNISWDDSAGYGIALWNQRSLHWLIPEDGDQPAQTLLVQKQISSPPIEEFFFSEHLNRRTIALCRAEQIQIIVQERTQNLLGEGNWENVVEWEAPIPQRADILGLKVGNRARTVALIMRDGTAYLWDTGSFVATEPQIMLIPMNEGSTLLDFNFVGVGASLIFLDNQGKVYSYSRIFDTVAGNAQWKLQQVLGDGVNLPIGDDAKILTTPRNRAFLIQSQNQGHLYNRTTGEKRLSFLFPVQPIESHLADDYRSISIVDSEGNFWKATLDDPFPEASLRAFFSKLWYEGRDKPLWLWQSSGATDGFEPKLSLVPLFFGTVKGAFYALLIAIPIALMASAYSAVFLNPKWRESVRNLMSMMASLPTVVLGFVAAFLIGPFIRENLFQIILLPLAFPLFILVFYLFQSFPYLQPFRKALQGKELIVGLPIVALSLWIVFHLSGYWESWIFGNALSPEGGFLIWVQETFRFTVEQRNALTVAVVMAFAAIPIVFSIAEESLQQVPESLRSASSALGATRWQTFLRVTLPLALPGVISAVMLGTGRLIGETMIVVMATGNTPLLELNPFTGMRSISANLAIELPEAPFLGTLYRTLLFSALLLFAFTLITNTFSELLRRRLQKRFQKLQ